MSRPVTSRRGERNPVDLAASCRMGNGLRDDAHISDISATGCCLTIRTMPVKVGTRIVIRPAGIEGLCATVRWIRGGKVGVEFDVSLYQPVVDHLTEHHPSQPVSLSYC